MMGAILLFGTGQLVAQERLEVTPAVLDLGFRPIGAWTEPATFTLENTGVGAVTVNNAEITASDFFGVVGAFPQTLQEGDTYEVGISTFGTATPGVLNGSFVAQWGAGRAVTVADFTANAYTPIQGDVVETAFDLPIVPAPVATPLSGGNATREQGGMYKNYILPNDLGSSANDNDQVYKLEPATDVLISFTTLSGTVNWAIYAEDFNGEGGPMATNALVQGIDNITDFELFAGTYYMVASSLDAWSGDYTVTAMPAPDQAVYVAPADGAVDIVNGDMLEWTLGANTFEYQVVLGTTYPPATVVVDWTSDLMEEYTLANLEPNLQYFWQVNTRNGNGTTVGEIWGFTTTLTPPQNFMADNEEIYEGDDVVLSWDSPVGGRAFLGYNVYQDGVKINTSLVTATTYTVSGLTYNMAGYDFAATAVYDEGESDFSDVATVQVSGEGMVNGNVSDFITSDDIAGATVEFVGDDEFGVEHTYTFTTNASGNYSGDVLAGTYAVSVSADGYIDQSLAGVAVAYGATVTNDFELLETAYPVAVVTASPFGDNILIEYSFDAPSFVPQVYPFDTKGMSEARIQKTWNEFLKSNNFTATANDNNRAFVEFQIWREKSYLPGSMEMIGTTSQTQFVDFDWDQQDWGVYKWYVVAVYDLNQSAPVASNPIDNDMYTMVDVTVALNSGDSPAGTLVEFTNVDESPELVYSTLLSADGMYTWDSFRRGTYDIEVSLPGYGTITETGVDIFDAASFTWQMQEILAPPANLYVTPTGLATWEGGSTIPFAPVMEAFDAGIPADWTQVTYSGDGYWESCDNCGTYYEPINTDGKFATADSDGNNTLVFDVGLFTSAFDMSGESAMYLDYDRNFQDYAGDGEIAIRTYSGGTGAANFEEELDWATTDDPSAGVHKTYMFDPSTYADPSEVYIEFWYSTNGGTYAWSFSIDNVMVTNVAPTMRAFETYKIFLDGTLLGEVTDTEYQHGGFGETLVDGQVYTTGVAAVFSTGQSATSEFTWLYVACDNYDVPADFMAEQVVGSLDINLSWTNVDAAALDTISALRIYRNGEEYTELDFTAGAVSSFLDEDLEFGDYTYCLTYIYDSGAETCTDAVCSDAVTITGGGYVNGTVTAFDGGAAISGATITVSNDDYSFEFTTDASGYYEGEVVDGTYNYLVEAASFESQTLEGVVVVYGATVTNDFSLLEFPFPVSNVIAEYQGENAVKVTWNSPGTTSAAAGVFEDFDNGIPSMVVVDAPTANWSAANSNLILNAAGTGAWRSAYYNESFGDFVYEVEMQRTAGATTGSMGVYVRGTGVMDPTPGNGEYANVFTITQGGSYWYATLVDGDLMGDWTGWLTSSAINTTGANIITVNAQGSTVQFFVNGTLVHTVNNTTLTDGFCGAFIAEGTAPTTTTWDYMSIEPGAAVAYGFETPAPAIESKGTLAEAFITYDNTVAPKSVSFHQANANAGRELNGYNVWRLPCQGGDFTFLGYTLDTTFVDNQFGSLDAGVYKWAVEAVYTNNNAEPQFSNCLDKDMITQVSVTVSTNSLDSPEETDVMFVNTSEPDLELTYETTLDATGFFAWDEFRKGTYDIMVEKYGFAPISLTGYVIDGPEAFVWVLEELLMPVEDLYVTPTGFATWRQGGIIPFEPFMENFDAGLPDTWTVVDGGNTSDTWFNTTSYSGNSVDGTPFMFANSDAAGSSSTMDEQLISPVINAENAEELYLMFDYVYQYIGNEWFAIDVYDGSDWVEVARKTADSGPFPWGPTVNEVIDITEYANAMLQVRFHYVSNGWNWYVAVDNVVVTDNMDRYADRALQGYKVWLDGIFVTDTPETSHQYDVTNLVPGQSYFAEVAAVYTNGISAKMNYTWTYVPCSDYPGPEVYTGELVNNDKDVLLTWSNVEPMSLVQVTQNPGAPANGYYQQFGYGYGVAYDLSAYPDALVNAIDFHHASWGTTGTWDYNIHIYDWDTKTLIATVGPIQTTGNDIWEMGVELGDISTGGASTVAILMEPLSNLPTDAYPDISSDNAADPQGSIYGSLSDVNAIGSSTIGNFLMDMYIYTANGAVRATPVNFDLVQAPAAEARAGSRTVTEVPVINQSVSVDGRDVDPFVGANIYRNGMMIAEMVMDTFYLDQDVHGGEYTYCLRYVYESGAMTCEDAYCLDIAVPCEAPKNLDGEYVWNYNNGNPEFGSMITWEPSVAPVAEWLFYDDGTNVDGIGGPASFSWAIKFDPAQLAEYDGASLTKIQIYNRLASSDELRIYEGTNAATLLHSQTLSGLAIEAWEEVDLTSPVLIDVTKELWITVYTTDGANYPAGCGPTQNQPNGDLITLDGVLWEHLSDYALPYTWNLRGYVTTAANATVALPMDKPVDNYNNDARAQLAVSGNGPGANNVLAQTSTRELEVFNVYRKTGNGDYSLLATVPADTFEYFDMDVDGGTTYCYQVTAQYNYGDGTCESAPAMALANPDDDFVCVLVTDVNELSANEARLYPNPATNNVTIEAADMSRLTVVNAVGQVVYDAAVNDQRVILNTSSYEAGVYMVRIVTNSGIVAKRVTIVR